jgi:hypothetical protein
MMRLPPRFTMSLPTPVVVVTGMEGLRVMLMVWRGLSLVSFTGVTRWKCCKVSPDHFGVVNKTFWVLYQVSLAGFALPSIVLHARFPRI